MNERLTTMNYESMASLGAWFTFPYIWGGLFLLLFGLYSIDYFGTSWSGDLIAGLLCLGFAFPIVPILIVKFIVRPIFFNLLGHEIISAKGFATGLGGFFLSAAAILFFLGRSPKVAGWLFLAAPVVGVVLTATFTLFERNVGPRRLVNAGRNRPSTTKSLVNRSAEQKLLPPGIPRRPKLSSESKRFESPKRRSSPSKRTPPPKRR